MKPNRSEIGSYSHLNDGPARALATLEALEQSPGRERSSRLAILQAQAGNTVLRRLFELTFDWRLSFPVLLPDENLRHAPVPRFPENQQRFQELVTALMQRTLSPGAAKKSARDFLTGCSEVEAKWYRRILERDLCVGIHQKLLRQVWPDLAIDFVLPLAPLTATQGLRMLVVIHQGCATVWSEGHRPYPLLEVFSKQLAKFCSSGVFDAELIIQNFSTAEAESVLKTHVKNVDAGLFRLIYFNARLWLNDFYQLSIFDPAKNYTDTTPFELRQKMLESIYALLRHQNPRTGIKLSGGINANALSISTQKCKRENAARQELSLGNGGSQGNSSIKKGAENLL